MKICINSRDELRLIELDNVVYLRAGGNYTDFHFVNGSVRTELSCLSDFEQTIARLYGDAENPFLRLGRSLLVNTRYIAAVNVNKQFLSFSADSVAAVRLPRQSAKTLKQLLAGKHVNVVSHDESL
ncbi:MAG: LytTR family transcriptional regulator DNA-binding domain-containing protein [Prevotella sp.]|nr:LytTR family transcriptional regulator DNA-binding domain-containing protein [Prevotella sp.]